MNKIKDKIQKIRKEQYLIESQIETNKASLIDIIKKLKDEHNVNAKDISDFHKFNTYLARCKQKIDAEEEKIMRELDVLEISI